MLVDLKRVMIYLMLVMKYGYMLIIQRLLRKLPLFLTSVVHYQVHPRNQ